jgi:hypothetical protein
MFKNWRGIALCAMTALAFCGSVFVSAAFSQEFQKTPVVLRALDVLPADLLQGPNYSVRATVLNDGFINTYDLDTYYGPLKVESTALLSKRTGELRALAQIEQLRKSEVYMGAVRKAAGAPVRTAEGLVQDPAGTVSDMASGIGRFFANVSTAVNSGASGGDLLNSALGQAAYKRQYAAEFGIDPYSSYEPLQKALNDLAWTAAAGGLTVKASMMAIPGGAGLALGAAGGADTASSLLRDKTPAEIAAINQSSLAAMGVSDASIRAFLGNTWFDPYEQALLVAALAEMPAVKDRAIYVDRASAAFEEPLAVFLRVRAQLISLYNSKTHSVQSFVDADGTPLIVTNSGKLIAIFPLDYVGWTSNFARKAQTIGTAVKQMPGFSGKEFWVTGKVDPVARKALEAKGWKVQELAREKLARM